MQPLTSLVTQHRGCAVKMGVPATLQPDGALRRPAHTGPSLAKPPEGAQSPNCTCPPGWVQKKKTHKRGRQEEAEQRSGSSSTQTGHIITECHQSQSPLPSEAEHLEEPLHTGGGTAQEEIRRGQHRKQWRNLWLGGTLQAHAHSGPKSFANRARRHLSRSRSHSSAETNTNMLLLGGEEKIFRVIVQQATCTRKARQGRDATKTPRPVVCYSPGEPPLD